MPHANRLILMLLLGLLAPVAGCTPTPVAGAATLTATPGTINSQLAHLRPGDTLVLQPGTYGVLRQVPSGSAWGAPVQIVGGPGVVVRGIALAGTRYASFARLTIDCAWQTREGLYISDGAGYIRVQDSEIKQCTAHGVLIPPESPGHNELLRLDIHHNGTRAHFDHGIYISTANNLIADSHIHHNAGYGVHLYSRTTYTVHDNVVRNNRIEDNGQRGGTTWGILVQSGDRNVVLGNVLQRNGTGDILVSERTRGTVLQGNQASGKVEVRGPLSEDVPPLPPTETPPAAPPPAMPTLPPHQPFPQARRPAGMPVLVPVGAIPPTATIPAIPASLHTGVPKLC